ncbi:early light-induced protein 1, chloroplastic-like [Silene latifolia]|uniref:early light-induced protein 1, chloroplastic-like n=1 Tax=Silene latifolia TaxID=37657 RepID=UPI003D76E4E4
MAMQMQSLVTSPILRLRFGSSSSRVVYSAGFMTRMSKQVGVQVKCMAKKSAENEAEDEVSTTINEIFAFNGPAPERINGRLAMIGFVAAVAVEVSKGTDLFTQISDGGVLWFLGTSTLISIASLVPLFKGETAESKTEGLMNSNAELLNGRLAMLGLVALACTEYVKGGALFDLYM